MSLISVGSPNLARSSDVASLAPSESGSISPLSFRSDCGAGGGAEQSASPRRPANQRPDSQLFFPISTIPFSSSSPMGNSRDSLLRNQEPASAGIGSDVDAVAGGLPEACGGGGPSSTTVDAWPKGSTADRPEPVAVRTSTTRTTSETVVAEAAMEALPVIHEAMSPSVAESIRAVFAAFVWHSGIVQDTLACAAFLKFNSGLTKQGGGCEAQLGGASVNLDEGEGFAAAARQPMVAAAEKRTRQRHSVEVISTTYLNYKENDWVDRLSGGNANRNVIVNGGIVGSWDFNKDATAAAGAPFSQQPPIPEHEEFGESSSSSRNSCRAVPGLPPTLGQLVLLWEGTVLSCLDTILAQGGSSCGGANAAAWSAKGGGLSGGGGRVAAYKNLKNNREANAAACGSGFFNNSQQQLNNSGSSPVIERPRDGGAKSGGVCDNWLCDICAGYFEPPVTYHMRAAHPGCGGHAGGKGYNSGGQYCGGWAGNCGDGGIGGSSWYLICERCKERHRRKYAGGGRVGGGEFQQQQRFNPVSLSAMLASFSYAAATSPVGPLDCHVVMKANSMFLLELASCGGGGGGGGEGGETTRRQLGAGSGYSELETVTELMSGIVPVPVLNTY